MFSGKSPSHRRLLTFRKACLGEIHGNRGDAAVQSAVHIPQVIQHPEVQGAAVVEAVRPNVHRRHPAQLAGVGFQHGSIGDFRQCACQGAARQSLISPRFVPIKGFAVQRDPGIRQGQGIHIRRAATHSGQQESVFFFPDNSERLPRRFRRFTGLFRFPGHVPTIGRFFCPAGIAGAVCPSAPRQQAQAQDRCKKSFHQTASFILLSL